LEWILLLALGAVIGAAGRLLHPGPDPLSLPLTLAIGIGSFGVSGAIFGELWLQIVVGVIVATALIFVYSWYIRSQAVEG
jgi:hypothetical protein